MLRALRPVLDEQSRKSDQIERGHACGETPLEIKVLFINQPGMLDIEFRELLQAA
jgi:hypothetical protein